MAWWPPLQRPKMQFLWSKTGWMPPEDAFRSQHWYFARKHYESNCFDQSRIDQRDQPDDENKNEDDDVDDDENEDVCWSNWIWWGGVLPPRSRDLPVDSVLPPLEVIDNPAADVHHLDADVHHSMLISIIRCWCRWSQLILITDTFEKLSDKSDILYQRCLAPIWNISLLMLMISMVLSQWFCSGSFYHNRVCIRNRKISVRNDPLMLVISMISMMQLYT